MMLNKSLRRIKNLVFKQKTTRVAFDPMWFLDCETTEIKARGLSPKVEKALVDIKENGVAVSLRFVHAVHHSLADGKVGCADFG